MPGDDFLSSLLGIGFMKIPKGEPDLSNVIDLRGEHDPPETRALMAQYNGDQYREFIQLTGWPNNWEEGESPNILRRRNPDGSFDYQPAIPEDVFGADESEEIARQPDEFYTSRIHRYPLRW
jgi:hypothetical protein